MSVKRVVCAVTCNDDGIDTARDGFCHARREAAISFFKVVGAVMEITELRDFDGWH
jgi:hypothetical protein|nr:hypothetical protein [Limnohabitans sp.]